MSDTTRDTLLAMRRKFAAAHYEGETKLARIEELERELSAMTRERDAWEHQLDLRDAAGSALQQDVDELRAEVERLRALLRECLFARAGGTPTIEIDGLMKRIRAALWEE